MLSKCPKCSGMSFVISEFPIENSKSVKLVARCENCGSIVASCIDNNPCKTDGLTEKICKLEGTNPDDYLSWSDYIKKSA